MAFFGMSKVFHVAAVQMRCSADRESNLENAERLVRAAAADGAQIVCLPEIFTGQYFCQSESVEGFRLAETIPGPSTERMQSLARELETVLVVPLFEKRSEGVYHNSAAIIDADGSLLGVYRKMHIPDDPGYYEKYYFTPGDLGFRSWMTHFGRIGVCICWDQWFPEAARLTAMSGAHVLFYPTAIGWHPGTDPELARAQHEAWQISMRAHSVANGCYVVAANRGDTRSRRAEMGSIFGVEASSVILMEDWQRRSKVIGKATSFSRWIRQSSITSESNGPFFEIAGSTPTRASRSAFSMRKMLLEDRDGPIQRCSCPTLVIRVPGPFAACRQNGSRRKRCG